MVTESFVAVALIAACSLVPNDYFAINSSAAHFRLSASTVKVVDLPHLSNMVGEGDKPHRPGGAVSLAVGGLSFEPAGPITS